MFVILTFILLVLLFRVILGSLRCSESVKHKVESLFCYISYFIIVLLAMFRSSNVGPDTLSYIEDYKEMSIMSFSDILSEYRGYEGYYLLSKLFSMMNFPCYAWFGVVEFILVFAIARFINKFSRDRLYSIILFLVTGLFLFSLAGLKQTLAMSLMLHAYVDLTEKKYIRSCMLIVFAYFAHPASLIALLAFMIYLIRKSKFVFPVVALTTLVVCIGGLSIALLLVTVLGNNHFTMYLQEDSSYTMSTLFLYILICLCTLPYLFKYYKSGYNSKVEISCVVLTCAFQYWASLSPSLFRLSFTLLPFLFVYVPNSFDMVEHKAPLRLILKYCALIGPILFFAYANRSLVYTFI